MENKINIDYREIAVELAKFIDNGQVACAIYKDQTVLIHQARGVEPMVDFWSVGDLKDAVVCDKVIGKASAMFLVSGEAVYVHGHVMSQLAADFLRKNNIEYDYDQLVDKIQTIQGDGLCPMESAVENIDDIKEGIDIILKKSKELSK